MSYFKKISISILLFICNHIVCGQTFQQILKNLEVKVGDTIQSYRYIITSYQSTNFVKNDSIVSSAPQTLKVSVNKEGVLIEQGHLIMWYDKEKNVVVDHKIKTILVNRLKKEKESVQIDNPLLDTLSKNESKIQIKHLNNELTEYKYETKENEYPLEITLLYHKGDLFFEKTISKHYFKDFTYSLIQEIRDFSYCPLCDKYKSNYFVEFISGTFQLSPNFKDYNLLYYDHRK